MKEKAKDFLESLWEWCEKNNILYKILSFVLAAIVLWVVFKLINKLAKKLNQRLEKKKFDKTISRVLIKVLTFTLKTLAILTFIGYVGIETSSIAAAITSAGVAVGLALQGSLSNGAAGIVILITRPFRIGDFIECNAGSGTVDDIKLFYTTLIKPDNIVIMIPNSNLISNEITNYSINDTRRLDETFSISYDNNFIDAEKIIQKCIDDIGLALDTPAKPFISISSHSASSIDILARIWVKTSDYWTMHFKLLEAVKTEFDKNNISIPYNQMDVHIIQ